LAAGGVSACGKLISATERSTRASRKFIAASELARLADISACTNARHDG
jgi:hypothetical protein